MAKYPIKYLGPKYSKGDTGEDLSIWYPGAKYPIGYREKNIHLDIQLQNIEKKKSGRRHSIGNPKAKY